MPDKNHKSSVKTIILTYPITAYNKEMCKSRYISHLLVMHAVIKCDVLHQYQWMCMLYSYKLIIFYLCISISENSTGGLTLSHNSVFVSS